MEVEAVARPASGGSERSGLGSTGQQQQQAARGQGGAAKAAAGGEDKAAGAAGGGGKGGASKAGTEKSEEPALKPVSYFSLFRCGVHAEREQGPRLLLLRCY